MEKEFISYELSLALKDIGFQSPSPIGGYRGGAVFYYDRGSQLFYDGLPMYSSSSHDGQIIAPTYSQAFRWFREKHNLDCSVGLDSAKNGSIDGVYFEEKSYNYCIRKSFKDPLWIDSTGYATYEEAQLECLKKLIQIVGQKVASVK